MISLSLHAINTGLKGRNETEIWEDSYNIWMVISTQGVQIGILQNHSPGPLANWSDSFIY